MNSRNNTLSAAVGPAGTGGVIFLWEPGGPAWMPGAGDAEEGWEDVSSNIIFLGGSPNFK